jgi:hypothetical protein
MRKPMIFGVLSIAVLVAIAIAGRVSFESSNDDSMDALSANGAASATQANIDQGKADLVAHNILAAREQFRLAVVAEPTNQEANLLYGVTRVIAVAEDGQTLHTAGLDSVREIFELAGFTFTNFSVYDCQYTKPDPLAPTTPQTGATIDFLKAKLLPEVDAAIANLAKVTNTSFTSVIDPSAINKNPGGTITIDYADALVIKALLQAMKCNLELLMVYGLNVDLPSIQANTDLLSTYKPFFNDPTFLTPKEPARLATAKTALISFIDNYTTAAQYLRNRSGSAHHLFVVDVPISDEAFSMTPLRLDKIRDELAKMKVGLNGGTYKLPLSVTEKNRFEDLANRLNVFLKEDLIVDLSKFFNSASPINFRTQLANCTNGTVLADPTIGGLFPLGITAAFSDKLPRIKEDILGLSCTGRETPFIKLETDNIYLAYYEPGTKPVTIGNYGTANLTISSMNLAGRDASEFTLSPGTCGSTSPYIVAPGTSCTAQVGLHTPYQYSSLEADIQINSNDVSSPRTYVALSGNTSASGTSPPLTGSFYLSINSGGDGSGYVEYSVNDIYVGSCSGNCSVLFDRGVNISLGEYVSHGSLFSGWSGCDYIIDNDCNVKMYSAKTVTANFTKDNRTPLVTAYPPSGTYHGPLEVTLAANKEANIYYTLNGDAPSSSSTLYTGPITISSPTTTLRYIAIDPFGTQSASKTETYSWLADPVLTVSMSGSGGGTVNSLQPFPGAIHCSRPGELGDVCTVTLPYLTVLPLSATTDSTSLFSGWSAAYCPGTGECKITLDANIGVTGTFITMPPVKVETLGYETTYHSSIQDAFAHAHAGSVISLQSSTFDEPNLTFNQPFSVSILGGYNAGFISQTDFSYLDGIFNIIAGNVTLDRFGVK